MDSQNIMPTVQERAAVKIVRPGQAEAWCALGEKFAFKLEPDDTGGLFSLSELVAQPRNGPPPHLHRREAEVFYVIDGDISFAFRDRIFNRSRGAAVYLPKDIVHTYNNIGAHPARMLVIATPCGFTRFVREWGHRLANLDDPAMGPCQTDVDRLLAAAPNYGIELRPNTPFVKDDSPVPPDPSYWVLGQRVTMKLTSKDTEGQFSLVEVETRPGTGVPPHWHREMDEAFYILEGTYEFILDSGVEKVEPGTLVYVPRRQLHGFRNAGTALSRLLDLHTPGGFEAFFEEAGTPVVHPELPPVQAPPDMDFLRALFERHGMGIPG